MEEPLKPMTEEQSALRFASRSQLFDELCRRHDVVLLATAPAPEFKGPHYSHCGDLAHLLGVAHGAVTLFDETFKRAYERPEGYDDDE